jgi:hypothetical protein
MRFHLHALAGAAIVSISLFTARPLLAEIPSTKTSPSTAPSPAISDSRISIGKLLYSDDFDADLGNWKSELEQGGKISIGGGRLEIDVPRGATIWFKPKLGGGVLIEYRAKVISAGGGNDRVSDLNCFWMARDARNLADIFAVARTGKFADYNQLHCYYVGLGGNTNTTTRFRRYIGDPVVRPLLPEHDLKGAENLLKPNATQTIQLVAGGRLIQYYRDGKRLFEYVDPEPYVSGWFAFRTTQNHMEVRGFRVFELNQ